MIRVFLLAAFLVAPALAVAQDPPIRWGQITDEEVALQAFPDDADASAVVLGDVGFAEVRLIRNVGIELEVRRHRRVKVLKEAGYSMGEITLHHGEGSDIRRIRGQTFVPEPDGSMRRVDLERSSIFKEKVRDGVYEIRFTMPTLAPGAIFEVEYTYVSESILAPPVWYFQSDEPTLVSEYRFKTPEFFEYVAFNQGGRIESTVPEIFQDRDWNTMSYRWTARNVPALRDEPYTTTEEDHTHKIELQLQRTRTPEGRIENVLSNWETLARDLDGNGNFGRRLRRNRRVSEIAGSVSGTDGERARALYDHVREGYVWDGRGGVFAERDLDAVVEGRGGSAGELNLLLLALLREAGVPAAPVLLSTRSNGRAVRQYPMLSRFNHLLVLVEPEDGPAELLDATDRHRPYGLLPVEALSGEAWIADPARPEWFEFSAPTGTATTTVVRGTLSEDGRIEGALDLRVAGYDALRTRTRMATEAAGAPAASAEAAEAAAEEAAQAEESLDIEVITVDGVDDPYAPIDLRTSFTASGGEVR